MDMCAVTSTSDQVSPLIRRCALIRMDCSTLELNPPIPLPSLRPDHRHAEIPLRAVCPVANAFLTVSSPYDRAHDHIQEHAVGAHDVLQTHD